MTSKLGHGAARDIYALLYAMCKANGGSYKCSHAYISERVQYDKQQCKQALKQLANAGYIERVNNSAGGRGCLTEYTCKKGCDLPPLIGAKKGYDLTPLIDEKRGTKKPPLIDPPYKYILNNNKVDEKENNIKESAAINRSTAPKPQPRFIKPTIEQVKVYIAAKGYSVDAEHFYNYYESQGWRVGRNPMKDWQAAVRTWEAKDKQQQYGKHRTNSTIANAVEAAKLGIALADAQRAAGY